MPWNFIYFECEIKKIQLNIGLNLNRVGCKKNICSIYNFQKQIEKESEFKQEINTRIKRVELFPLLIQLPNYKFFRGYLF